KIIDNNDIEKNTYLFFLVWRNFYTKSLILQHLKFYNIHYFQRTFNLDSFCAYPFKKYLGSMKLIFSNSHEKLVTFLNHLPPTVKSIELGSNNANEPLEVGCFPKSITNLKLNYWFNQQLEKGVINSTIQSLTLGKSFNNSLIDSFPSRGLTYLDLGFEFDQPIFANVLPKTLKTLIFSDRFNQKLYIGSIPKSVENLTFGGCFNRDLEKDLLPEGLVNLTFGYSFNKPISVLSSYSDCYSTEENTPNNNIDIMIDNITLDSNCNGNEEYGNNNCFKIISFLPYKLKSIKFGSNFDRDIDFGVLPSTLTSLEFSVVGNFNKPITFGTIPNSVTNLSFPSQFNQPIKVNNKNCLPPNLTKLSFGRYFQQDIEKGSIPSSVTDLCLGGIDSNQVIQEGCIPDSVLKLKVGENQIFKSNSLPDSVYSLQGLNAMYIREIPPQVNSFTFLDLNDPIEYLKDLPRNVVSVDVGGLFDTREFERAIIPSHITSLTFGSLFNQRILPSYLHNVTNLKSIKFGIFFNQIILPCSLPDSITYLEFDQRFNQILSSSTLPKYLKTLILGNEFNSVLKSNSLPINLVSLRL
ncbi:hypothetical protein DICPUDRAFT_5964, partial [Dictyostelium purpureum]